MQNGSHRTAWEKFVAGLAIAVFCVATLVFIDLAARAPRGDYLTTERKIMEAFRDRVSAQPIGPQWLPDAVRDITAIGSAAVLILVAALALGFLCLTRKFHAAIFITIAIAGGEGLNTLLKESFRRARPDITSHLVTVQTSSFPSGHAMAASIFYLTVGAVLAQTTRRRREKIYLMSAALLLTALTGVSRVYLGVHYPTDVLAGWSAGAAWAVLCWLIAGWLRRRGQLEETPAANA